MTKRGTAGREGLWRRSMAFVQRRWKILAPVAAAGLAAAVWLAFGYFGVHTLFIDKKVDEPPPFLAGTGASGLAGDAISEDAAKAMNEAMTEEGIPATVEADEPATTAAVTLKSGEFIDRSHPTVGTAVVLSDGGGRRVLRLEDFRTDNGPDLNVYLSTALPDAPATEFDEDFFDLGDLKGNIGSQNYEIPDTVDLDRYRSVVIWCVRFTVAFGAAPLQG